MIAKRKQYDILHCHIVQGFHSVAAVIVGKLCKKKVVLKIASSGVVNDFIQLKQVLGGKYILRFLKKQTGWLLLPGNQRLRPTEKVFQAGRLQ